MRTTSPVTYVTLGLLVALLIMLTAIAIDTQAQSDTGATIPPVCATATRKPTKTPTVTPTPTPQGTPTATRTPGIGEPVMEVELWLVPMIGGGQ